MSEYEITKEEKIKFLAMLECSRIDEEIKADVKNLKERGVLLGFIAIIGGGLTVLTGLVSGISLLTLLITILPIDILGSLTVASIVNFKIIKNLINNIKEFEKQTNGKITYKDYKKFIKDGTIERWKSDYKEEINNRIMEIEGYTLDSFNLEDCENVSRSLSDFLEELIPFKYYLEVSTPGIERKLKSDKEYLIFKGKDINLKLKEAVDESGEKQFVAKIVDFDEKEGLTVFAYKDKQDILIKKENIISAKLYSSEI